jgi:mRNA interferase MazF
VRPIHLVQLDKLRPAVILTREEVRNDMNYVAVAPITSSIRGLGSEVLVGQPNGIDHDSDVACDNIQRVARRELGPQIGWLLPSQERALQAAIVAAFTLEV